MLPGIDVIFIGTSDLSFALGLRGEQNHPRLEAAVTTIARAAKKHGKAVGRPAVTVKEATAFQKKGFQFFFLGSDVDFLRCGAAQILDRWDDPSSRPRRRRSEDVLEPQTESFFHVFE